MIKFEYEAAGLNPKMTTEDFVAYLNDRGQEGWEHVETVYWHGAQRSTSGNVIPERSSVIFKRKIYASGDSDDLNVTIVNNFPEPPRLSLAQMDRLTRDQ